MAGPTIENSEFRRILNRNIALPLGMSILSAVVFVAIIAYLVNGIGWVEHTQRVISGAHEVRKLCLRTGISLLKCVPRQCGRYDRGVMQCVRGPCGAARRVMAWRSTVWCSAVRCGAVC